MYALNWGQLVNSKFFLMIFLLAFLMWILPNEPTIGSLLVTSVIALKIVFDPAVISGGLQSFGSIHFLTSRQYTPPPIHQTYSRIGYFFVDKNCSQIFVPVLIIAQSCLTIALWCWNWAFQNNMLLVTLGILILSCQITALSSTFPHKCKFILRLI